MKNDISPARNRTRKRRFSVRLLAILGGLAVGLLFTEVTLRIVGYRYLNLYQEDQRLGFALRPGAEGWWKKEGVTYIKINSDGLRDREHSKVKPTDTLRIAVLGDSYAEALHVPMEAAFWSVMGERLQGCGAFGGQKVEVINFGISGASTARELLTLRHHVWQYSPDIVVLTVTTGNDIGDNSRELSQKYASLPLPYFVRQNGALVFDDSLIKARNESFKFRLQQSFIGHSLNWLRTHVRVVGLMDEARLALQEWGQKKAQTGLGYEPGLYAQVYLEPAAPAWDEAWHVTEQLILLIRDEVKARGAKFLTVTGSNSIQIYPDLAVRQDFMRKLGANDLFYPDRRIKSLGEREGIEVLNLAPALQEYADQNKVILHGTNGRGHWNALGHREVGDRVAVKICEMATANR
jgi:hypothetical protein